MIADQGSAVKHAWLLGRFEPTPVKVVEQVRYAMSTQLTALVASRQFLIKTTRAEEERFLVAIEGGLARPEKLAPAGSTRGSTGLRVTISGEDEFKSCATLGVAFRQIEAIAIERGSCVDGPTSFVRDFAVRHEGHVIGYEYVAPHAAAVGLSVPLDGSATSGGGLVTSPLLSSNGSAALLLRDASLVRPQPWTADG